MERKQFISITLMMVTFVILLCSRAILVFAETDTSQTNNVVQAVTPSIPQVSHELTPQDIPNNNFRNYLGKLVGTPITKEKLATITSIEIITGDKTIDSLKGIEYCSTLTLLNIPSQKISDLTPLAKLTELQSISLGNNNISNISTLSQLNQLQELYMNINNISNISPISQLPQLHKLMVGMNDITDINVISNMKQLEVLDISANKINDIKALSSLTQLHTLYAGSNHIKDISSLNALKGLLDVVLDNQSITLPVVETKSNVALMTSTIVDLAGNKILPTILDGGKIDTFGKLMWTSGLEKNVTKHLQFSAMNQINGNVVSFNGTITQPIQGINTFITIDSSFQSKILVGDSFNGLKGITATNIKEGNITSKITISGTVNTSKAGVYPITYRVVDSSGNATTTTITITVSLKAQPPIKKENLETEVNQSSIVPVGNNTLPNTATSTFNLMGLGILFVLGGVGVFLKR